MRNLSLTLLASLMALPLVACTGDDQSTPERRPYRDDWRVEADVAFEHTVEVEGELMTAIFDMTIGGRQSDDNFANRGDVIVNFDGPPDKILVEFRRFTTNLSEEAAANDFDAISLWAFNTSVASPSKPVDMDAEANCITGGWLSGCGVRLYYDGQKQLERAGADIRVTLPPDYRRKVNIITEDADNDGDYLNRGNVCVYGTNGALDVEMQSGEAFVIIDPEATPAPACGDPPNTKSNPSSEVAFCNDYVDTEGNDAAWSTDCTCASNGDYGVVAVESDDSSSANIAVDVPTGLWAAITAENRGDMPQDCVATVDIAGLVLDEAVGNEAAWEAKGTINAPSSAVTPGAGYNIQARSGACNPVSYTERPDDFVGLDNGELQESEQRGNVTVCDGCLRMSSCDQHVP